MNRFSIQSSLKIIIFSVLTLLPTLHGSVWQVEVKNQLEKHLFIRGRGRFWDEFAKVPIEEELTIKLYEPEKSERIVCCWEATKTIKGLEGEEKTKEYFKGGNFVVFDDQIKKDCHDGVCPWKATKDALVFSSASDSENPELEYQWKEADQTETHKTCKDVWWDDEKHEFFKE